RATWRPTLAEVAWRTSVRYDAWGMSVESVLERLLSQDEFRRRLTLDHTLPARPARYAAFPEELDSRLAHALASRGISPLYTHQADAASQALRGEHAVIVTPTASGKTL